MINALDDTLAALLRSSLPEEWAGQVQISFAAPDNQFPPQSVTLPAIDLFLYDVRENLELRSNDSTVTRRDDGTAVQHRAPVRVDFSYLVTAWPSLSVTDPWEDEHRLLGEVMRALLRYRTVPQHLLRGELARQELPLPVSSLQPGRLQGHGEFWHALGGKPKVTLNYTVTVSVDVGAAAPVTLVTDKLIHIGLMSRPAAHDTGAP